MAKSKKTKTKTASKTFKGGSKKKAPKSKQKSGVAQKLPTQDPMITDVVGANEAATVGIDPEF